MYSLAAVSSVFCTHLSAKNPARPAYKKNLGSDPTLSHLVVVEMEQVALVGKGPEGEAVLHLEGDLAAAVRERPGGSEREARGRAAAVTVGDLDRGFILGGI